jgi:DNA replication protein DnaC
MYLTRDRHYKKSIIFYSQVPFKNSCDLIEEKIIIDAILDRITHRAIRLKLKGESIC